MSTVAKEQYLVSGLQVTHQPTGAKIRWASNGRDDFELVHGTLGEVLENGEVFDEADVLQMGIELLMKKRFSL